MCQLHLRAAGFVTGRSKLSTEKFGPIDCQSTVHQRVTRSGMLEEKPNCMKYDFKKS